MKHLYTGLLLVCLLVIQDTAVAFFFRTKPLTPNRHWLKFKYEGGEVEVKLNLKNLRVLAERNAARAQEVFDSIELLPFARNPLLVVHLLKSSAFFTGETIKNIPLEGKNLAFKKAELSQSKRDALWAEFYQQKELEDMVCSVYDDVLNTLLNNKKLLKLLAITDPNTYDYKSMLEARQASIDREWRDHTTLSQFKLRYAPELPSNRILTKQEYEQLEKALNANLTEFDPTLAQWLRTTSWNEMDTQLWREVRKIMDNYSQALYYQAVVAELLVDSEIEGLGDRAKANYLASDLVKFFYVWPIQQ